MNSGQVTFNSVDKTKHSFMIFKVYFILHFLVHACTVYENLSSITKRVLNVQFEFVIILR